VTTASRKRNLTRAVQTIRQTGPNIAKGIPPGQLGPSGKPKIHIVEKSTRKQMIDAARHSGHGKPIKHTKDRGQPTHYHSVDRDGNKLRGKDNVHFCQRGSPKNPE
jgi:fructose/tagatose bisphosphate aldolase